LGYWPGGEFQWVCFPESTGDFLITVQVKLYGHLQRFHPEPAQKNRQFSCSVPYGSSVEDLQNKLGIPGDEVEAVFINHRKAALDGKLEDGDLLTLLPLIAGG